MIDFNDIKTQQVIAYILAVVAIIVLYFVFKKKPPRV